jgi:hypothetical protein
MSTEPKRPTGRLELNKRKTKMENYTYYTNINAVFDSAEQELPTVKAEFMYMHTVDGRDFFKNKITRSYESVTSVGDAVGQPMVARS